MKKPFAVVTLALAAGVLLAQAVAAQGILIGPSTRNGSFEDGVLTPWFGNGIGVQEDPAFATDGSWYAMWSGSPFPLAIQNLPADANNGLGFLLTFDARTGTPGLNTVAVQMTTRAGSSSLSAIVTPVSSPLLSLTEWQSYQMELRFPLGGWSDPVNFSIGFGGSASEPRVAFLDNVVLQQVPEPSSLALLVCGAFLLAGHWLRRLRRRA